MMTSKKNKNKTKELTDSGSADLLLFRIKSDDHIAGSRFRLREISMDDVEVFSTRVGHVSVGSRLASVGGGGSLGHGRSGSKRAAIWGTPLEK